MIKVNQTIAAVAGVMGANQHSVTKSTTSIVLEAALFDPVIVRKASKQCGVRTESSARFEKGVDVESLDIATNRVIELIGDDDSIMLTTPIQAGSNAPKAHEIHYKLDQINEFLL